MPTWRSRIKAGIAALVVAFTLAACGMFDDGTFIRNDPPTAGYVASLKYVVNGSPKGDGEKNEIELRGFNNGSPMPWLSTVFGKGASSKTQLAQITGDNGAPINVLGMNKWGMNFGVTDYLDTEIATYEQRDAWGNRVCGAKVRLNFKPNIAQVIQGDKRHGWDALFYYTVPCGSTTVPVPGQPTGSEQDKANKGPVTPQVTKPDIKLDISKAKFLALVINQQATPRVTGKPILFNRGHSVTIVGGRASYLVGGWWGTPASVLNGSYLVKDLVNDLNRKENDWLKFSDSSNGDLVYSAGDADVYLSLKRMFLNRQSAYLVNFRSSPKESWSRVLLNPIYNYEWNDFKQNYEALKGEDMPDIDDMVDKDTGLPKKINDPDHDDSKKLKEIETAGCQNCPNPTLEQIQFIDMTEGSPTSGQILYAMTIRGWLGAQSSLVMFGKVPGKLDSYLNQAETRRKQLGMTDCQVQRDENGEKKKDSEQYSSEDCARWLREGALWDLLSHDASKFGFDVVGQFRVRDNSSWASHCHGSGESTSCTLEITNRRLDAAYMFTDTEEKLQKAWTILQLLGEVGMRTLGMSYASGAYDGSGLDYAMAQSQVYNSYYNNTASKDNPYNPEMLFALDARALQLPTTLGQIRGYLYGTNEKSQN